MKLVFGVLLIVVGLGLAVGMIVNSVSEGSFYPTDIGAMAIAFLIFVAGVALCKGGKKKESPPKK